MSRYHLPSIIMRSGAAGLALMVLAAPVAAQTDPVPKHRLQKLAEGVYAAWPAPGSEVGSTSGFIIGKRGVWLFDALRSDVATRMEEDIRALTSVPIKYIVNSHHHWGLVLGNAAFPNATVVAHVNTRPSLIAKPPAEQIARTAENEEAARAEIATHITLPIRYPDLAYTDRLVFYDDEREIHVIHFGRFHTDNDSVIYLPKEKILFAGDLLPGLRGPGSQQDAHFRDFVASIDKALALDVDVIVPGRGDKLATKEDLRQFRGYLADVVAQVQSYVDRGATLAEAQAGMKIPPYIDPARLSTRSFKIQWRDTIEVAYAELKAAAASKQAARRPGG